MKKLMIGSSLLIAVGMFLGVLLVSNFSPNFMGDVFASSKDIGAKQPPTAQSDAMKTLNESFSNVSEAVVPSVVSIRVEVEVSSKRKFDQFEEFFKFFGDPRREREEEQEPDIRQGHGSGVFISENGYIITNNHVVEDAKSIKVTTHDKKVLQAELVGSDPLTDLAVLKVDGSGYPAVHFADIESLKTGEWVMAVGNPLGLNSTVTSGIISAIGRGRLGLNRDSYSVEYYIQTDAAINPGNSGGGLFDMNGSLAGINTAIATRTGNYIGYGFAIPVDLVRSVAEDIIEDGKIDRGYIGIRIQSVRDEIEAKAFGLDEVYGVKVEGVLEGSAAEDAGIQDGDVLLEVNGKKLYSSGELQSRVAQKRSGDKINLTILRDGKKINKTVTLKARDGANDFASSEKETTPGKIYGENDPIEFENLGFKVKPLNDELKNEFDVDHGVLVSQVKRYSAAAERGMFPNGVIIEADRKKIKSTKQLKEILDSKEPGDAVLVKVKYPEVTRILAIQIPETEG